MAINRNRSLIEKISDKDKEAWKNLLIQRKGSNKDQKYQKKIILVEKKIDLHGYTLENANIEIENLLILF